MLGQDTCTIKSGVQEIRSLDGSEMEGMWINLPSQQKAIRIKTKFASSSYHIALEIALRNCNFARVYTPITIGGVVEMGAFDSLLDLGGVTEMSVEKQPRLGVEDGSLPLFVIAPDMATKIISQSNYLAGVANILTVIIGTRAHIAPGSRVTLTGLTGMLNPPSVFDVSCVPPAIETTAYFSNSPSRGTLLLTIGDSGLRSVFVYIFWKD